MGGCVRAYVRACVKLPNINSNYYIYSIFYRHSTGARMLCRINEAVVRVFLTRRVRQ